MPKLLWAKFYLHCPDCRQRMRRVVVAGHDAYSAELGYECLCGACWTYTNFMSRGLPEEDRSGRSDQS